jgi:tRNA 2-thiouridine synthesizing protein B
VTLHIFSVSPTKTPLLTQCCSALGDGDALLLLGEGVHAAAEGSEAARHLETLPAGISLLVLDEDCRARGLKEISARVTMVDYSGFVLLACEHARSVSWF